MASPTPPSTTSTPATIPSAPPASPEEMEQVQGKQEDEDSDEDSEEDMELGDEEYLVADDSGAIAEPKAAESLPADKEAADKAAAEKAEEERAEKCRQTFLFMQNLAVEDRRAEEEQQRQKKEKELQQTNKREASEKHRAEEKAAKQKNEEARRAEEKEQRQKKQEQLEETNKREASEKHRAEDEAAKQKTEDFWTKRDADKQRKLQHQQQMEADLSNTNKKLSTNKREEQTKRKEEEGKKQKEKKLKEPAKMKAQAEAGPSKTNKNSSTNNREQQRKRKLEEANKKEEKKLNKEEELQKEKVEAGRKEIETEEQPLQQTIQDKTNAEEEVQNKEEEEDKVEGAKEPAKRKSEAEAVGSHKSKRLRTNKNYVEKKVESDLSSYESSPSDSSQNDKAMEMQLKKKKIYNKGQPRSSRRITYTKAELDVMKLKPAKPGRHNTLQAVLQQENIIDPFNNYLFFWAIGEITPHWVSQRFKDEVLDEAQQKLPNCKTQEDWREFQRPENYEATGNVFAPFPNHQQLVRYQITGEEKQKVLQYALNRCREVVKPLLPKDFKAKIQPGPIPKSNSHGENRAMRIRIASLSKQNKTLSKQLQLAQDTTIEGDPEVVSSGFTMPTSFQSFEEQWNFIRQLLPCMSAPDRKSALGNYNISKVKKFIQTFSL